MEYERMAKKLVVMQVENARPLSILSDAIAARGEEQILMMLAYHKEPAYAGDLACCVGLTSGRVANILKQLERKGYVQRTPDTADKRKVLVSLTAEGEGYAREVYHKTLKGYATILRLLGHEDAQEFMRVLQQGVNLLGQHEELFQM